MSKQVKRKITVNIAAKNKTLPKTRPSVFERLGTKAGGGGGGGASQAIHKEFCHHWAQTGTCPYGKNCKYSTTHTLISPSKQRAAKKENEKKRHNAKNNDNNDDDSNARKRSHAIGVKATVNDGDDEWNEEWDPEELEDADPDDLEKRRQELQRELELQTKMDNKTRKKDKKTTTTTKKKEEEESSPSSEESSSSSSESSSSSDESSSSSSSSVDTRRKKTKKSTKAKRDDSSSSSDDRAQKRKTRKRSAMVAATGGGAAVASTSSASKSDKSKKLPIRAKAAPKSPSPIARAARKQSQTPPPKAKTTSTTPAKKAECEAKSPRAVARTNASRDKYRTPSPRAPKDAEKKEEREKERGDREREKEREKKKEEREKLRARAERENKDRKGKEIKSPKHDQQQRMGRDAKKKDSPDSSHSRKPSPSRSRGSSNNGRRGGGGGDNNNNAKDRVSPAAVVAAAPKDDRRADRRGDERDRSRPKDRSDTRSGSRATKEKRDASRDRERERERERRIAREEREAAREKEREEALARCQERQRERERLKELARKEEEEQRNNRSRERSRRDERGADKPSSTDRLTSSSLRKANSLDKERAGDRRERRDRSAERQRGSVARKSPEQRNERRSERVDKGEKHDRYERGYERDVDREFQRYREIDHRPHHHHHHHHQQQQQQADEKRFDSPYERGRHEERGGRYVEIDRYSETSRDDRLSPLNAAAAEYGDERRSRRDVWDARNNERDLDRRRYGAREESARTSTTAASVQQTMKGRGNEWPSDYGADGGNEWDRGAVVGPTTGSRRGAVDWDGRDTWDRDQQQRHDRPPIEDEWRHYGNRSMDAWPLEERRRWPAADWRERSRSRTSHNRDAIDDNNTHLDNRRKEPLRPVEPHVEPKSTPVVHEPEPKKEPPIVAAAAPCKRIADVPLDACVEPKKPCVVVKEIPLEDDLSEISDDADEILNRDEEISEAPIADAPPPPDEAAAKPAEATSEQVQQQTAQQPVQPVVVASAEKSNGNAATHGVDNAKDALDEENMELDFEEISEDELEEETRVKGIGDALGVDWSSLVAESRPRTKPSGTAKIRWDSSNVLIELGVSIEMAGARLVAAIANDYREHKKRTTKPEDEEEEEDAIGKTDGDGIKADGEESKTMRREEKVDDLNDLDPIAAIQVAKREQSAIRRTLFASAGPYRRALSARRDLTIRRHLCNLPVVDTYVEAPKRHDAELYKLATQLFERCL